MDTDEYFSKLSEQFDMAYDIANKARAVGFDPKEYVEIKPAPDLASRVEGLISLGGIADLIRSKSKEQSRSKLAFDVAKEICTNDTYANYETLKRIELAVRVGTAILTEGVLVAPIEGIQGISMYKNPDNTEYIAIIYAGPIRGAGGTAAALSVALADFARKIFGIGTYKPTQDEIERYVEETELYHTRCARLQYKPSDDDLRVIISNCPVCVDGLPTESVELSVHSNMKKIGRDGREVPVTNRVRGGAPLVLCEGIAQKAKKVLKEVKSEGLDWDWLNKIIKVEVKKTDAQIKNVSGFLEELVAGRPILSYPGFNGGFRLRYGRSRFTGIAAKGFSPATMIILMDYIAIGTQLKIEFPGKGCVAAPVDSIEGPFVKLKSGDAFRVNDAETARKIKDEVAEIISLGDMLVTYGDFKKSNTPLQPSSYVEEMWLGQLVKAFGKEIKINHEEINFENAYMLSMKYDIPIHPKFLFEFQAVGKEMIADLAIALSKAKINKEKEGLFGVTGIELQLDKNAKRTLELLNVPHRLIVGKIEIYKDYAQSLLTSLGFASGPDGELSINEQTVERYNIDSQNDSLSLVNSVAPFKVTRRSTFVGSRIGRPEKAKERLMKPAPNVLFPIGGSSGKERNVTNAYMADMKKFGGPKRLVEIATYKCSNCKRVIDAPYCYDCEMHPYIERKCPVCSTTTEKQFCEKCGTETIAYEQRNIDLTKVVTNAMKRIKANKMPGTVKGVLGLTNKNKVIEPLEKGILRTIHNVFIFKDGTARFDATDLPLTHFYPREIGVSVEKLKELGYDRDYLGNELKDDDQLLEMKHQDVILNKRGADYFLNVSKFMDEMLQSLYGLQSFYNAVTINDLIGQLVITLSPHTSCGVLNRVIGFTSANVGFAHPYIISARRRNCDGDEDTTMLLLDGLINFSKEYLPGSIGGTMDAPLILTLHVMPEEVDDEAHVMEVVTSYGLEFYNKTYDYPSPSEVSVELVESRLGKKEEFSNIRFTHSSSILALSDSPKKSLYTTLKTMSEKVDVEFKLMDMIDAVDKRDAARKLIMSHFIPDLIGNLHSFSKQMFRCSTCNAKYRRVPLQGKCTKDGGRLILTISRGGIEKYLEMAIGLADRYSLDLYIRQRLKLVKEEINCLFGEVGTGADENKGQFNLSKFI